MTEVHGHQGSLATENPAEVKRRAERTMANLDAQPYPIRALAHEYGWLAVSVLLQLGVSKPTAIEHAITTIRGYGADGDTKVCRRLREEGHLHKSGRPTGTAPTFGALVSALQRARGEG